MNAAWWLVIIALLAGISIPTQAGINATLDSWLKSPVLAATVSFGVGTLTLVLYTLVMRLPIPPLAQAGNAPAWSWFGGVLGAFFVTATIMLAPKLGATTMLASLLAGQMIAGVLLDHFGLLGFPVQTINLPRIAGLLLVASGVYLIRTH